MGCTHISIRNRHRPSNNSLDLYRESKEMFWSRHENLCFMSISNFLFVGHYISYIFYIYTIVLCGFFLFFFSNRKRNLFTAPRTYLRFIREARKRTTHQHTHIKCKLCQDIRSHLIAPTVSVYNIVVFSCVVVFIYYHSKCSINPHQTCMIYQCAF